MSTKAAGMKRGVEARAWCRVDLAGGTLDIWPLGLLHGGARTVNLAIDRTVTVRLLREYPSGAEPACEDLFEVSQGNDVARGSLVELLEDPATALVALVCGHLGLPPVRVEIESQSPRGGGLGASSAMTVALLGAGEQLVGRPPSAPESLAKVARDLEARLMSLPTGTQDHFPALLGGVLEIEFAPGGSIVSSIEHSQDLSEALVVAYSGQSHFSAGNNWQVIRGRLEGEANVTRHLEGIAETSQLMAEALRIQDYQQAGRLMSQEWSHRRQLAEAVSTKKVEALLAAANQAGAWGGKVCGAGGGGCLAWLVPQEKRVAVKEALRDAGAEVLRTSVAEGGLRLRQL